MAFNLQGGGDGPPPPRVRVRLQDDNSNLSTQRGRQRLVPPFVHQNFSSQLGRLGVAARRSPPPREFDHLGLSAQGYSHHPSYPGFEQPGYPSPNVQPTNPGWLAQPGYPGILPQPGYPSFPVPPGFQGNYSQPGYSAWGPQPGSSWPPQPGSSWPAQPGPPTWYEEPERLAWYQQPAYSTEYEHPGHLNWFEGPGSTSWYDQPRHATWFQQPLDTTPSTQPRYRGLLSAQAAARNSRLRTDRPGPSTQPTIPPPPPPAARAAPVAPAVVKPHVGLTATEIKTYAGKRVIIHLKDNSMLCGVLRQALPNGDLIVTESLKGIHEGSKTILGKTTVPSAQIRFTCAYRECFNQNFFPLAGPVYVRCSKV